LCCLSSGVTAKKTCIGDGILGENGCSFFLNILDVYRLILAVLTICIKVTQS
jgi:hypothetical protein